MGGSYDQFTYTPQLSCPPGQIAKTKCERQLGVKDVATGYCQPIVDLWACFVCNDICVPDPTNPPTDACTSLLEQGEVFIRSVLSALPGKQTGVGTCPLMP